MCLQLILVKVMVRMGIQTKEGGADSVYYRESVRTAPLTQFIFS